MLSLLDYNNDDLLDIFLVNGGKICQPHVHSREIRPPQPRYSGRGRWYLAKSKALSVGLSNAYFKSLGLPTLIDGC